jgi:hypothetical protein
MFNNMNTNVNNRRFYNNVMFCLGWTVLHNKNAFQNFANILGQKLLFNLRPLENVNTLCEQNVELLNAKRGL